MDQTESMRKIIKMIDDHANEMSRNSSTSTMTSMSYLYKQALMFQAMETSILISSKNREIELLQERLNAVRKEIILLEENASLKENLYKNDKAKLESQLKENTVRFHRNMEELHCKTNEIYESIQKLKSNG
jgi:hypothetical protein